MDAATEVELMQHIAEGDATSFRALSEHHARPIFAYAARLLGDRHEAEEVAQETFLKLWQHAGTWQPRARVTTWLHTIATRQCLDRLRRRRETLRDTIEEEPASNRPSLLLRRKQLAEAVDAALADLPERQRAAVVLVHYQGLGNAEVAEVLETGVEAVESLLARGRRALRHSLKGLAHAVEESA